VILTFIFMVAFVSVLWLWDAVNDDAT